MEKQSRVFIAGHRGLVGSAIHRVMTARGFLILQLAVTGYVKMYLIVSLTVKILMLALISFIIHFK